MRGARSQVLFARHFNARGFRSLAHSLALSLSLSLSARPKKDSCLISIMPGRSAVCVRVHLHTGKCCHDASAGNALRYGSTRPVGLRHQKNGEWRGVAPGYLPNKITNLLC